MTALFAAIYQRPSGGVGLGGIFGISGGDGIGFGDGDGVGVGVGVGDGEGLGEGVTVGLGDGGSCMFCSSACLGMLPFSNVPRGPAIPSAAESETQPITPHKASNGTRRIMFFFIFNSPLSRVQVCQYPNVAGLLCAYLSELGVAAVSLVA